MFLFDQGCYSGFAQAKPRVVHLFLAAALLLLSSSASEAQGFKASTLSGFRHHPGITMSLFAKEPMVVSPSAIAFSSKGDCYVTEMRDYPYGFGPDRKPGGTVRKLVDQDQDGAADASYLFAEGLSFPTSITVWKKGVIVLEPPRITYFEDTDGDHRADVRQVLIDGLVLGVTDSNANGLRWDNEGWLHAINGGNGGELRFVGKKNPVVLGDADFAFRPESGEIIRTYSTGGGFGLVHDGFGHTFTTHNTNYLQQRILPVTQVERNSAVPARATTQNISDLGLAPRIYPISVATTRMNHPEQAGHFSSAGGMGILLNSPLAAWPDEFKSSLFICDVVSNLVHRARLREEGPLYRADRFPDELESEFIASTDPAFRPVGLELGPDGALYLIDFHRDVIEHPDYIPAKLLEKLDLRAGDDRGRIYKIEPIATASAPSALCADLQHAAAAISLLSNAAGEDAPDIDAFREALGDKNPLVRETATRLASGFASRGAEWRDLLTNALRDEHPRVRFTAALCLDGVEAPGKLSGLAAMMLQDAQWDWSRYAVMLAVDADAPRLLLTLLQAGNSESPPTDNVNLGTLVSECASVAAAAAAPKEQEALMQCVRVLANKSDFRGAHDLMPPMLAGFHDGWERVPQARPNQKNAKELLTLLSQLEGVARAPELLDITLQLGEAPNEEWRKRLDAAALETTSQDADLAVRLAAIDLLSRARDTRLQSLGIGILSGPEPSELQSAALQALSKVRSLELGEQLVAAWPSIAPALRQEAIQTLLGNTQYHEAIVSALERNAIAVNELNLDLEQRRTLLRFAHPNIRERAAKFYGDHDYGNRKPLVEQWLAKLPKQGDAELGRQVFTKKCADCHQVGDLGRAVGPPLASLGHRSVEDLLSHILDPNMAINPNYVACMIETHDGELVTGLLATETPAAVTLLMPKAETTVVPRSKIAARRTLATSLMPEGLEQGLDPLELRSLVAFLQQGLTATTH